MHHTQFDISDVNRVSYSELGELVERVFSQIHDYLDRRGTTIDVVVPVLRSGGVLGSMCAVHFKTTRILPVQFKYFYNPPEIKQMLSFPEFFQDVPANPLILICEGNTSSGSTARRVRDLVLSHYSDARFVYATLTQVYDPEAQPIEGFELQICGALTNENFIADDSTTHELNLRPGITVFPWENAQDELNDINAFYESL